MYFYFEFWDGYGTVRKQNFLAEFQLSEEETSITFSLGL